MTADLFADAGSLRGLYEELDWSETPLGPVETWSPTLRATVRLVLSTQFACTLLWGHDRVLVYNEAYVPIIGAKHPAALGAAAADVFDEAWPIIGPLLGRVTVSREATWTVDALVPLERRGYLEECYFTYSYSPVVNERGEVEGVLDVVAETTLQVIARRRLELLERLRATLADMGSSSGSGQADFERVQEAVLTQALAVLSDYPQDLPRVAVSDPRTIARRYGVELTGDFDVTTDGGGATTAWLRLPDLGTGAAAVLEVSMSPALAPDDDYVSFLRLVASSIAQELRRAWTETTQRATALSEREFSDALQRSLLTEPAQLEHIRIAVRYAPATNRDQIGGDWYDAFLSRDGALNLVIGDVSGHDRSAAVAMGQARNLMRGISFALDRPPGATLEAFDDALGALEVDTFITAVLARVEPERTGSGHQLLRWSTAGHPPPLLLEPDGSGRFLEEAHEPMLGLTAGHPRSDSAVHLVPGATLVLYTDGLVERRHVNLDECLDNLRRVAQAAHRLDVEELADHLLDHAGRAADDDVALMVVRFRPQD